MRVEGDAGYAKMFRGAQYRFCSRECLDKFDATPDRYLTSSHAGMEHKGHAS
jgi:YHS domain-containing protein